LFALYSSFLLVDFTHLNKKAIKHLNSNLEEYKGEVLESFTKNLASVLVLS